MALNYTTYINSLSNLMPVPASDPGFIIVLPNIIDDAEQRLYRELDLLNTRFADSTTFVAGSRDFNLPSAVATFVTVERINIITPSTATTGSPTAVRNPLTPCSADMLDFLWPSVTGSAVPSYFAMKTQTSIIVGPFPDKAYVVEVIGTQRPAPLSTSNVTTLLSVFFPDCLIAASMVFAAGYMKNFGAQVDDPRNAVSWESHLQELIKSAHTEEMRKKFTGQGWSSKEPATMATPPRT